MANPKVFVSSTCYDLRQIRSDIKAFIEGLGYELRLSEFSNVPYNSTTSFENDCYTEVSLSDIIVGIIGGRFGSESSDDKEKSISMKEMNVAIDKHKQIYIFVVNDVLAEYHTYKRNKDNKDINYCSVDDPRIFQNIEKFYTTPNIQINGFSSANDITDYLRLQWAGLFQSYISNKERNFSRDEERKISQTAEALANLNKQYKETLEEYRSMKPLSAFSKLMINPVYSEFRDVFLSPEHPYIFFTDLSELRNILSAFGYEPCSIDMEGYLAFENGNALFRLYEKIIFNEEGHVNFILKNKLSEYRKNETPIFELSRTANSEFSEVSDDDLPF